MSEIVTKKHPELEYLKFVEMIEPASKRKTKVWFVEAQSSGEILGEIRWYAPWRQYCFYPSNYKTTIWSTDCMIDICLFIAQAERERKRDRAREREDGDRGSDSVDGRGGGAIRPASKGILRG